MILIALYPVAAKVSGALVCLLRLNPSTVRCLSGHATRLGDRFDECTGRSLDTRATSLRRGTIVAASELGVPGVKPSKVGLRQLFNRDERLGGPLDRGQQLVQFDLHG